MSGGGTDSLDGADRLAFIRSELRFELGLLHDRVNALVAAEAFLTIAYTAAMSNGSAWGPRFSAVVAPILAVLGLLLALLAWPGVATTVVIVLDWTAEQTELLQRDTALASGVSGPSRGRPGPGRGHRPQWRSMLFFRWVPGLFAVVWVALAAVAIVLTP